MIDNLKPGIQAFLLLVSLLVLGCFYGAGAHADFYHSETMVLANLDINYPGAGARYFLSKSSALEMRVQYEKNITVIGGRFYHFPWLFKKEGVMPYAGIEVDYASFKGEYTKGKGFAGGVFAGVEYCFSESFSAQMDAGTSYLYLKDTTTAVTQNGIEYILNFGINFYFLTY